MAIEIIIEITTTTNNRRAKKEKTKNCKCQLIDLTHFIWVSLRRVLKVYENPSQHFSKSF